MAYTSGVGPDGITPGQMKKYQAAEDKYQQDLAAWQAANPNVGKTEAKTVRSWTTDANTSGSISGFYNQYCDECAKAGVQPMSMDDFEKAVFALNPDKVPSVISNDPGHYGWLMQTGVQITLPGPGYDASKPLPSQAGPKPVEPQLPDPTAQQSGSTSNTPTATSTTKPAPGTTPATTSATTATPDTFNADSKQGGVDLSGYSDVSVSSLSWPADKDRIDPTNADQRNWYINKFNGQLNDINKQYNDPHSSHYRDPTWYRGQLNDLCADKMFQVVHYFTTGDKKVITADDLINNANQDAGQGVQDTITGISNPGQLPQFVKSMGSLAAPVGGIFGGLPGLILGKVMGADGPPVTTVNSNAVWENQNPGGIGNHVNGDQYAFDNNGDVRTVQWAEQQIQDARKAGIKCDPYGNYNGTSPADQAAYDNWQNFNNVNGNGKLSLANQILTMQKNIADILDQDKISSGSSSDFDQNKAIQALRYGAAIKG